MRKKQKKRNSTVADICYATIVVFLDGKLNGAEMSPELNPFLLEALQKIRALKLAVEVACALWSEHHPDDPIKPACLERQCLKRVMKFAPK
jgi:hypothetical protein